MIGCIIQARMGSTRLPGKVMKKIDGKKSILEHVIKQLSYSTKIEKIIVATTDLPEDDVIIKYLISKKIDFFKGSSEDVLDRYFQCANEYSIDTIVRITADNPLIDPKIVDLIVEEYEKEKYDLVTNTIYRTFPYGTEVEVFSFEILKNAWKNAKKPSEREHVTPYIRNLQNKFHLKNLKNNKNFSQLRYTVDRKEDLEVVKEIIKNIHEKPILLKHILKLYKTKPNIFKINENVKHDGYLSSLNKDKQYLKSAHEDDF